MEEVYLIINPGSASKKYALYHVGSEIVSAHFEKENGAYIETLVFGEKIEKTFLKKDDFVRATKLFIDTLVAKDILKSQDEIGAIGLRIVAPGEFFTMHKIIDAEYEQHLSDSMEQAPLHIGPAVYEIELLKKVFPHPVIVGISDSAYHATTIPEARHYALAKNVARRFGIYRYGYHGISAQSVVRKFTELNGILPGKIVLCHWGSGSSITAIKEGNSFDTSMGFTPLEGMMMATRVGNIDPGAVLYLAKKFNGNLEKLSTCFNAGSGLLGVSGKSADTRELIKLEEAGNADAALALSMVVHRIKKYVGAYIAALNGIDALIFTGTIGERSCIMRSRVCKSLDALGIIIDEEKNNDAISGDHFIQSKNSKVLVAVVVCDEMKEMAREVALHIHKKSPN